MKLSDSDRATGLLYLILAVCFVVPAIGYGFGSVRRLGAGVFPLVVGLLLALVGLLLVIRSLCGHKGAAVAEMNLRTPAYIVAALVFAAATLRVGGIAVAVPGAVLISSRASRDFPIPHALGLAALLTVFVWLVFVVGFSVRLPFLAGVL